MAMFRFFDNGIEYVITQGGLDTHAYKMYLSNAAPDTNTMNNKAELPGIPETNGYTEFVLTSTLTKTPGTSIWSFAVSAKPQFTASGGDVGPFRRAVLYDDTATDDRLIGFYDYLADITVLDGDPFVINLNSSLEIFRVRT